ncbi:hypothetical protein KIH31_15050 [Paenarthrobacter sp. DKR-5]|uniref:hypothetical protein n=1 Tax=Paenarthrobacter sp. DKR-5 TaxID=2835535 RepID=UPI001BDC790B|nr:hypothetical protein [Paenarthrobacter sp. DKR-5]MBT1003912.1 hypothetical protein [Paenarthrobacter sp. DKR-5]
MTEADGINEAVEGAMRTGLMVAARIGEQLARLHEEEQRTIAAAEEQRARQLQHRFDAQRAAARAQLAPTARDDWWGKATPAMIEQAHETATAWKPYDPDAAQASERIRREVQSRYGINVESTGADERAVSAALARAQQARIDVDAERNYASAVCRDEILANAMVAGGNRQDAAAREVKNEPTYDSAERRARLARSLEGRGDREAVTARLLADLHQGAPATGAVTQNPGLSGTSKVVHRNGKARGLERDGLDR